MKSLKPILITVWLLTQCAPCAWPEQVDWEKATSEQVAHPPQAVALEYRFIENEVRRYDVKLAGEGMLKLPGQSESTKLQTTGEMIFTEQVMPKDTSDDYWRISRKLAKGEMTIPDFGKLPMAAPQIEFDINKRGAVRTIKGLDQLSSTFGLPADKGLADILSQLRFVGFPDKELKVSDTWDDSYSIQLAGQEKIPVKVTSTLIGFDRVLKTDCATILTKYEIPFSFSIDTTDSKTGANAKTTGETATPQPNARFVGKETGEFRTYFSYTDGKIVQSFGTIELTADMDAGDKPSVKATANSAAATATTAGESSKHGLSVKYYVTSTLSPAAARAASDDKGVTP